MSNPVGWFELYVQDMARARSFYEAVLDLKLSALESPGIEMWTFNMDNESYGASGALVSMPGMLSGGGGTLVYFSCTDCAVEAGRVVAAGGQVQKEKFSIGPYGFIALAQDTEGNMFGLHSMQ
jgi:uncharacterized protein